MVKTLIKSKITILVSKGLNHRINMSKCKILNNSNNKNIKMTIQLSQKREFLKRDPHPRLES